MNAEPKVTICILTYNRARFLPDLLDSIADQHYDNVEIILSDDASSDDTPIVAAAYAARIPNLRYVRHETNIGLDRHFFAAVEAATGEYAWLMGDDDRIQKGGVARVLEALSRWPRVGGLTLGVTDYDQTLSYPTGVQRSPPTQLLTGAGETFTKLADVMGFMSAMVVRRDTWLSVARDPAVAKYHNLYAQVYMMGRVAAEAGTWGVVAETCVDFRKNNDQFLAALAWRRRLDVDVIGYEEVAEGVLGEDLAARKAMRRLIFNTHIMARLRGSKDQPDADREAWRTAKFLYKHYADVPEFWSKGLPCVLVPSSVFKAVRSVYRNTSKRRSKIVAP